MNLSTYLESYLGGLSEQLGLTDTSDGFYTKVLNLTLEDYGVSTEDEMIDAKKMHRIAEMHLWKSVMHECSLGFNISVDGSNYSRSQAYDMAQKNFADAYINAYPYLSDSQIQIQNAKGDCYHDEFNHW
jgi:hypothetical protein